MSKKNWVLLSGGIVSESALADHSSKEKLICIINQDHPEAEKNGRILGRAIAMLQALKDIEKELYESDLPVPVLYGQSIPLNEILELIADIDPDYYSDEIDFLFKDKIDLLFDDKTEK